MVVIATMLANKIDLICVTAPKKLTRKMLNDLDIASDIASDDLTLAVINSNKAVVKPTRDITNPEAIEDVRMPCDLSVKQQAVVYYHRLVVICSRTLKPIGLKCT